VLGWSKSCIDVQGRLSTVLFHSRIGAGVKGKGKAVPLQAWGGPEGYRNLMYPDFMTTRDAGKFVSLTHRSPLPTGKVPGTHFC